MSKFKVGEIAIFAEAATEDGVKIVGTEVLITDIPGKCINNHNGIKDPFLNAHIFDSIDGSGICEGYQLKKLPPKDDLSSWEAMKDIFVPDQQKSLQ